MITMNQYYELIEKVKKIEKETGEDYSGVSLKFIRRYAELLKETEE